MYTTEIIHTGNQNPDRFQWDASAEAAYWEARAESYVTAPVEIDLHKYMDVLGTLPPLDWQGDRGSESFKFAEMMCGNVTDVYAKVGERYFTFRDKATLTHATIIRRITKEVLSKEETYQK